VQGYLSLHRLLLADKDNEDIHLLPQSCNARLFYQMRDKYLTLVQQQNNQYLLEKWEIHEKGFLLHGIQLRLLTMVLFLFSFD